MRAWVCVHVYVNVRVCVVHVCVRACVRTCVSAFVRACPRAFVLMCAYFGQFLHELEMAVV